MEEAQVLSTLPVVNRSQVFAKLLKGEKYTLPSKAQLMQLPTPQQKPIAIASDANYDPVTNQSVCRRMGCPLYALCPSSPSGARIDELRSQLREQSCHQCSLWPLDLLPAMGARFVAEHH